MARTRSRKGRKLRWRNAFLLGGLFIIFLCLIVVVNLGNQERKLILPKKFAEQQALRADPDQNVYIKLQEAYPLLLLPPLPLIVSDPDVPLSEYDYQPDRDTVSAILEIKRPERDEQTLKFIDDTREIVRIAIEASKHPNYVTSHAPWLPHLKIWSGDDTYYSQTYMVLRILMGHAMNQILYEEDWQEGIVMLDAHYKLVSTMARAASGSGMWLRFTELYTYLPAIYRRAEGPEKRAVIRSFYEQLPLPQPDMQRVLENAINNIDETLSYPGIQVEQGNSLRFETRVESYILQRIANATSERHSTLIEIAGAPLPEYPKVIDTQEWSSLTRWTERNMMLANDILQKLFRAHADNAFHEVMEVTFAIEDYRTKYDEYPETLDALVPEFYDTLPLSPLTNNPLNYELVDEKRGYTIKNERVPLYEHDGEIQTARSSAYVQYWRRVYD